MGYTVSLLLFFYTGTLDITKLKDGTWSIIFRLSFLGIQVPQLNKVVWVAAFHHIDSVHNR